MKPLVWRPTLLSGFAPIACRCADILDKLARRIEDWHAGRAPAPTLREPSYGCDRYCDVRFPSDIRAARLRHEIRAHGHLPILELLGEDGRPVASLRPQSRYFTVGGRSKAGPLIEYYDETTGRSTGARLRLRGEEPVGCPCDAARARLVAVFEAWIEGRGSTPMLVRRCNHCEEERPQPLPSSVKRVVSGSLGLKPTGADVALFGADGELLCLVYLSCFDAHESWGGDVPEAASESVPSAVPRITLHRDDVLASVDTWQVLHEENLKPLLCECKNGRIVFEDLDRTPRTYKCPRIPFRADHSLSRYLRRSHKLRNYATLADCAECPHRVEWLGALHPLWGGEAFGSRGVVCNAPRSKR